MIGLGIGLPYTRQNDTLQQLLRNAGAVLALVADGVRGYGVAPLDARTLPNGVKNSDTIQRVSGDVVLTGAMVISFTDTYLNSNVIGINLTSFANVVTQNANEIDGAFVIDGYPTEMASSIVNAQPYAFRTSLTALFLSIPKTITTIEEAKTFVAGIVVRYQLNTPIDILNAPVLSSWIDVANTLGRNLFNPLSELATVTNPSTRQPWGNGLKVLGTLNNTVGYISIPYNLEPSKNYYVKAIITVTSGVGRISVRKSDKTGLVDLLTTGGVSFTTDETGAGYFYLYCNTAVTTGTFEVSYSDIMVAEENIPYEPYTKNNALMQGLANTQDSGVAYEPLVCETGAPVEYENLVPDPLFNDITPWIVLNGAKSASGGIMTITGTGASTLLRAVRDLGVKPSSNSRLSQRIRIRVNQSGATSFNALLRDGQAGTILGVASINNPIAGQWYSLDLAQIVNCGTLVENVHLFISATYPDAATQNGKTLDIEKPQVINLSTPQIAALEAQLPTPLTALECDRIFPFVATAGVSRIGVRPLMMLDGINDYGALLNTPSVDIVGTGDFAIAVGFLTPSVIQTGYLIAKNLDDGGASCQYAIVVINDGRIAVVLGASITVVPVGTLQPNTMYDLRITRAEGRLITELQSVPTDNRTNTTSLISRPFLHLGTRSNSVDGVSRTSFFKGGLGWIIVAVGSQVANLPQAINKIARNYRRFP